MTHREPWRVSTKNGLDSLFKNERASYLVEALDALPEDQQMAVELHHLADLEVTEIAELMNRSKASVAGLLRRGLSGLRDSLKDKQQELL